jgi:hypothetical protein
MSLLTWKSCYNSALSNSAYNWKTESRTASKLLYRFYGSKMLQTSHHSHYSVNQENSNLSHL